MHGASEAQANGGFITAYCLFVQASLSSLDLLLRSGATVTALTEIAAQTGASAVYCSRQYQPWSAKLEKKRFTSLSDKGVVLSATGHPAS